MSIKDLCNRELVTIGRDDTIFKAAELIRQNHVGDVLVVEKKNDTTIALGIVTDRDVVVEIVAPGLDPKVITVGDIMLPHLACIEEDRGIFDAIKLMTSKGIRRLPVVDSNGSLIGILTLDDLLLMLAKEFFSIAMLLSNEQKNEFIKRR
ncbi:MAG TPA: CBS domain-containing protein [Methylotenera sp.]